MLNRRQFDKEIEESLIKMPITALIGPRQVGKTTLAKIAEKKSSFSEVHFFDLEDPTDEKLFENIKLTLEPLKGLIIIDEIQRKPEIFRYLRVKADQMGKQTRILILGSSSRDLIEKASESLAGRIRYIEVTGFGLHEVENSDDLFFRGGFPRSYLAKTDHDSHLWLQDYSRSYIERDLRSLGMELPAQTIRRMVEMLTGFHGQIFNSSEIGKSLGFSHTTARKYLDILVGTFLIRELKPWNAQILQRQVKQPKIYFRDTGLLNYFSGVRSKKELHRLPRLGSYWEGFALEETIKQIKASSEDLYFWALHQGAELDLLWQNSSSRVGFEFKYSDHPEMTKSMHNAVEMLQLDKLYIVYPGDKKADLSKKATLIPLGVDLRDA